MLWLLPVLKISPASLWLLVCWFILNANVLFIFRSARVFVVQFAKIYKINSASNENLWSKKTYPRMVRNDDLQSTAPKKKKKNKLPSKPLESLLWSAAEMFITRKAVYFLVQSYYKNEKLCSTKKYRRALLVSCRARIFSLQHSFKECWVQMSAKKKLLISINA